MRCCVFRDVFVCLWVYLRGVVIHMCLCAFLCALLCNGVCFGGLLSVWLGAWVCLLCCAKHLWLCVVFVMCG